MVAVLLSAAVVAFLLWNAAAAASGRALRRFVDGLQASSLRVAADGQLVKITGVCFPFPRALRFLHHEFCSIGLRNCGHRCELQHLCFAIELVFAIALRFSAFNSLILDVCEQQLKNIGAITLQRGYIYRERGRAHPYPNSMSSIFHSTFSIKSCYIGFIIQFQLAISHFWYHWCFMFSVMYGPQLPNYAWVSLSIPSILISIFRSFFHAVCFMWRYFTDLFI